MLMLDIIVGQVVPEHCWSDNNGSWQWCPRHILSFGRHWPGSSGAGLYHQPHLTIITTLTMIILVFNMFHTCSLHIIAIITANTNQRCSGVCLALEFLSQPALLGPSALHDHSSLWRDLSSGVYIVIVVVIVVH